MSFKKSGRALFATAAITAALIGTTIAVRAPNSAAEPPRDLPASPLILEPGERGYTGRIDVVVTYTGDPTAGLGFRFTETVPASLGQLSPDDVSCGIENGLPELRVWGCALFGDSENTSQQREFSIAFEVLTKPRARAMSAPDVPLEVIIGDLRSEVSVPTLFRSTGGSLDNPVPYVQDTQTDLTVTAAKKVTLTKNADGEFEGWLKVRMKSRGDAPHENLAATFTGLPEGVAAWDIRPTDSCFGTGCVMPGGAYMQGEARTAEIKIVAPAGTAPGSLGTASVTGGASWGDRLTDVDPADNTASFQIVAKR